MLVSPIVELRHHVFSENNKETAFFFSYAHFVCTSFCSFYDVDLVLSIYLWADRIGSVVEVSCCYICTVPSRNDCVPFFVFCLSLSSLLLYFFSSKKKLITIPNMFLFLSKLGAQLNNLES